MISLIVNPIKPTPFWMSGCDWFLGDMEMGYSGLIACKPGGPTENISNLLVFVFLVPKRGIWGTYCRRQLFTIGHQVHVPTCSTCPFSSPSSPQTPDDNTSTASVGLPEAIVVDVCPAPEETALHDNTSPPEEVEEQVPTPTQPAPDERIEEPCLPITAEDVTSAVQEGKQEEASCTPEIEESFL